MGTRQGQIVFMKLFFLSSLVFATILSTAQVGTDDIRKSIFFDGGSYEIDEYQAVELSRWLDSIPNLLDKYEIQLISHTDPIGGKRYNEWLSKMRSLSVFLLLLSKDIPEHIIHAKDWGLENPVYSNDNYRGMILNRRVDVILHPIVF
jgi:outer membrane protein OmpA-like peptidoglycan-associated protein